MIHVECIIVKFSVCLYSTANAVFTSPFPPFPLTSPRPSSLPLALRPLCPSFGLPLCRDASLAHSTFSSYGEPTVHPPHPRTGALADSTSRHNPALRRQLFELQCCFTLSPCHKLRRQS